MIAPRSEDRDTILSDKLADSADMTSMVPIVAGPAMIGMESGTTIISVLVSPERSWTLPWDNEIAVRKSSAPAPIRNASIVIPKRPKIYLPNRNRIRHTVDTDRVTMKAVLFRSRSDLPLVIERNADKAKKGVRRKKKRMY